LLEEMVLTVIYRDWWRWKFVICHWLRVTGLILDAGYWLVSSGSLMLNLLYRIKIYQLPCIHLQTFKNKIIVGHHQEVDITVFVFGSACIRTKKDYSVTFKWSKLRL